jgi:hypothetical protein
MTTTDYSELALQGVSDIAANLPVGGFQYTPQVKAAVDAGLAYDSDPTYWASDMNIGRSAALTELGQTVARDLGLFATCACTGCRNTANPEVMPYCRSCQVQGNREGWVYSGPETPQCYMHYLWTHDAVMETRKQRLEANLERRGNRNDWERRARYEEALKYVDPGHQRVREARL